MTNSQSCLESGKRDSPQRTRHLFLSFVSGWGAGAGAGRAGLGGRGRARMASLTQLSPPLPGLCPAHVPGGRQSRAETWSLLSDSTVDTRYSGKKWLAPTGETQPGLSCSQPCYP